MFIVRNAHAQLCATAAFGPKHIFGDKPQSVMVKTSARADLFLMEKARVRVTAKMAAVFADRSSKGDAFMMSWIYLDYN